MGTSPPHGVSMRDLSNSSACLILVGVSLGPKGALELPRSLISFSHTLVVPEVNRSPDNDDAITAQPGVMFTSELNQMRLRQVRSGLSDGSIGGRIFEEVTPYVFHLSDGTTVSAEGSGIEGFAWTFFKLLREGREFELGIVQTSCCYLNHLSDLEPQAHSLQNHFAEILASESEHDQVYRLAACLDDYLQKQRAFIRENDPSHNLARELCCYHIFVRAFDLAAWREARGLPRGPTTGRFFEDLTGTDIDW